MTPPAQAICLVRPICPSSALPVLKLMFGSLFFLIQTLRGKRKEQNKLEVIFALLKKWGNKSLGQMLGQVKRSSISILCL